MTFVWTDRRTLIAGAFCLVAFAFPTRADDGSAGDAAEQLAGIRAALDRIVSLMESQVRHQDTELLIRRITLRERRIEPLERQLRSAEDELRGKQDDLERLRTMIAEQENAVDRAADRADAEMEGEARLMLRELEGVLKREEPLVDAALLRVRELEDRILEEREEIRILDDLLMERLE